MAYGIEINNIFGALRLDSEDLLTRILHRQTLAAGTSGSVAVSGFVPSKGFAVVMRKPGQDKYKLPHQVTVSGSTVTYTAQNGDGSVATSGASVLIVGMYK